MIRIFKHYVPKLAFVLVLLEVAILAGLSMAVWLLDGRPASPAGARYLSSFLFAGVIVTSMGASGMYQHTLEEGGKSMLLRIVPAFLASMALLALMRHMTALVPLQHGALCVSGALAVLLTRLLVMHSVPASIREPRAILLGSGELAKECLDLAAGKSRFRRFHIVGCCPLAGEPCRVPAAALLPPGASLLATALHYGASEIVVSVVDRRQDAFPVRQLLDCVLGGVKVMDAASFFEREACQIRVDSLQPSYLIFGDGFDQGLVRATAKRVFDLIVSAAIGVIALPVMLAAALLIWVEDGGPIFYRQERVGKHGRLFSILKLRSMSQDAEKDGRPIWAAVNDARVTKVGSVIRKLRIDELPQILNVAKGDMSWVGPRPERAHFVGDLGDKIPYYDARHSIKPGITGLAQVRYPYGASIEDAVNKLQYDLYYVKNNSMFLDVLILVDTVQVVLFGKGGR